jgi:hypothetical protein
MKPRTLSSSREACRRRGLLMGRNAGTGQAVALGLERLATHLSIAGPPGAGKTKLLTGLYRQLLRLRNLTPIVVNFKGSLGRVARDIVISEGQASRLLFFDPGLGSSGQVPGFDPLKPNGVAADLQAKAVRDAICGGYGDDDLSDMPQLARMMHIVLSVGRRLELNLPETVELLYPASELRAAALSLLPSSPLKRALEYFDGLNESRQDQVAASTVARLEGLVMDETLRGILTQRRTSLDFGTVFREHRALILNLELKKPFTLNDAAMFARMAVNAIVNECFATDPKERGVVLLIIDEASLALTPDLARALDLGRELGLWCVLSTQRPEQYELSDGSQKLRRSVEGSVVTHLYFGGLPVRDLEDGIVQDCFLDGWNEREVKDEFTSLELDPRLTWKRVSSVSRSWSENRGRSIAKSESRGRATSRSETDGTAETTGWGKSEGRSRGMNLSFGHQTAQGRGTIRGQGDSRGGAHGVSSGSSLGFGSGQTLLPDGNMIQSSSESSAAFSGESDVESWNENRFEAESDSSAEGESEGVGFCYGENTATTTSESRGRSRSLGRGDTRSESRGRSVGENQSRGEGGGESVSLVPVYEYDKRRNVTGRTYVSREEYLTRQVIGMRTLPKRHYVLKVGTRPAVILEAPFVRDPWVSKARREEVLEHILSSYGTCEEASREDAERRDRLRALAPPPATKKAHRRRR